MSHLIFDNEIKEFSIKELIELAQLIDQDEYDFDLKIMRRDILREIASRWYEGGNKKWER